jgi:hypothetical protein
MRAVEFIVERKKRRRRPRYAAYGPGPYGGYGYYAGYSGDSGEGGGNGGGGESIENEDAMMGKIEDSGKIVRILKKQHSVPFSDEKNWLLIDIDPAKGNKGLGLKWVPASTRFTWVRPYRDTAEKDVAEGDKMSRINLDQSLADTPPVWKKFISSLPPQLAREFVDERPIPNQEDIDYFTPLRLTNLQPVAVSVADLLKHPENQGSIGRSPDDVIDAVNQQWGLKIPSGKKYDPNPARYRAYAQMTPGTASPSVAVDGEIIFGAGRFVAAALRGDETMRVWNMTRKQAAAENFADGKNPQDKGDSKRHGINTKASVSSLRKTAKQGGRKGQLAHWLANMKAGRAKKNK